MAPKYKMCPVKAPHLGKWRERCVTLKINRTCTAVGPIRCKPIVSKIAVKIASGTKSSNVMMSNVERCPPSENRGSVETPKVIVNNEVTVSGVSTRLATRKAMISMINDDQSLKAVTANSENVEHIPVVVNGKVLHSDEYDDHGGYVRVKTHDICAYCNETFDEKVKFLIHGDCYILRKQAEALNAKSELFKGDKWLFECDFCTKTHVRRVYLYSHIVMHLEKNYVCKSCSRSYNLAATAQRHCMLRHPSKVPNSLP